MGRAFLPTSLPWLRHRIRENERYLRATTASLRSLALILCILRRVRAFNKYDNTVWPLRTEPPHSL